MDLRLILRQHKLFQGISEAQFNLLMTLLTPTTVKQGEWIVREGDQAEELYIIETGTAEVIKFDPESGTPHQLGLLYPGEVIGEVTLLDKGTRSASVRALSDCKLARLAFDVFQGCPQRNTNCLVEIQLSFARELSKRLRSSDSQTITALQQQLTEAKARAALGMLLCTILILNSVYLLAVQIAAKATKSSADSILISLPLLMIFGVVTLIMIKKSGYPRAMYGITLHNWKRSALEALIVTLPLLGLIAAVKWLLIQFDPRMSQDVVFEFTRYSALSGSGLLFGILGYAIFIPLQEMIARGSIQGALQVLLVGKHRYLLALVLANVMFSLSHLHLSLLFVLLVFPPGMLWGWLYARHGTFVGASLSHILVGVFAFYVVGFHTLLHG
jgi:CRP-like cAMP-binding protein